MSFASISCCRGPTKADIESAWRPGATAERIGSRGIRPRQELATASMVPGRVALGEALINMQRTCFALAAYSTPMLRGLAGGELHSFKGQSVCLHPGATSAHTFANLGACLAFGASIPRSTPPSGATRPGARLPPPHHCPLCPVCP